MSPLDAISAASAVVSFVDFSMKLVARSGELYASSKLEEHTDLELIQGDLDKLLDRIEASKSTDPGFSELVQACRHIGSEIHFVLTKLKLREGGSRAARMGKSTLAAMKTMFSSEKIKSLQARLEGIRSEIQFKLIASLSNHSDEYRSAFAIAQQQFDDLSHQASVNVTQIRQHHQDQISKFSVLEQQILTNVELQLDVFDDVAVLVNAEAERRHLETMAKIRSADHDVQVIQQQLYHYNEHFQRQVMVDGLHTRGINEVIQALDSREQQRLQDERNERVQAVVEQRERILANFVQPRLSNGKARRMSKVEAVTRVTLAATVVVIGLGVEAFRKADSEVWLPFAKTRQLRAGFSAPKIQRLHLDGQKIGKPFKDLGRRLSRIPKPDMNVARIAVQRFTKQIKIRLAWKR